MDDYKCLTCIVLKEKLDEIDDRMEELKECNKRIKEYVNKQIKLTDDIKELLNEYKKLKKYCNN